MSFWKFFPAADQYVHQALASAFLAEILTFQKWTPLGKEGKISCISKVQSWC